ncbi:MAG: RCC1 repeat-containing protein [Burkholderiales bacterium PBB3]|nr:MAG: RCC1 repeat-containing protein [Burkholderiales bacterium PBB3]
MLFRMRQIQKLATLAVFVWALPIAGHAATPAVSVGREHCLALHTDGSVLAWGSDREGQLGQGRQTYEARPGLVARLSGIRAIGTGANHAMAIRTDGSLWTWGSNSSGQLGDDSTAFRSQPVQARAISRVSTVCGGESFSAALDVDGAVWTWGETATLGTGAQEASRVPAKLPGITGIRALACGSGHVLALRQDGKVLAWGANDEGQLGDGSRAQRLTPVEVTGLSGVKAIVAGNSFSAALKHDGTVWEWGVSLPFDTPRGVPRVVPVQTVGLSDVVSIYGGEVSFGLVAIHTDGQSWSRWITGTAPIRQSSVGALAGASAGYGVTLLRRTDGSVLSYGFSGNGFGSLGDGTTTYRDVPGPVVDISNIVDVTAGTWHGLALDASGRVWAWGLDTSGQLGRGRILGQSVPAVVQGLPPVVQVSAGTAHNLAIDESGAVWAWGSNGYGQLGDGSYADRAAAVKLTALSEVIGVAAGSNFSLAVQRDGSVWYWGGTLPGVSTQQPALPTRAMGDAKAVSGVNGHVLVLKRDGTVWSWGYNPSGQLGNGSLEDATQPQPVAGLSGIQQVIASDGSSYALASDDRVFAWGSNWTGQLGDGTLERKLLPVVVTGLGDVLEIAAGNEHALARKRDGSVWGWGLAEARALGSLPAASAVAVPLSTPAQVQQLSAGGQNSALLTQDGLVYMAGGNSVGELGDGTFAKQPDFVLSVNANTDGLLDLAPSVSNTPLASAVPLFLVKTERRGDLSSLTLRTNVFGLLGASSAQRAAKASVGYNLYVVALVGNQMAFQWVSLDSKRNWRQLSFPVAEYLAGVSLTARTDSILINILDSVDVTALLGARIFVGYGLDALEMVATGRYREVMTIALPAAP